MASVRRAHAVDAAARLEEHAQLRRAHTAARTTARVKSCDASSAYPGSCRPECLAYPECAPNPVIPSELMGSQCIRGMQRTTASPTPSRKTP
eukprot:6201294-Pleurochrysis_carterae.AAC.1